MARGRVMRSRSGYGRKKDYLQVLRRRTIIREILVWSGEIIGLVGLAALIAYFLL